MATTNEFCDLVRTVTNTCKASRLRAPSFRTPPRRHDRTRTVLRYPDGTTLVSVKIAQRSVEAVRADLVEGVLVANDLKGEQADNVRAMFGLTPTSEAA